MVKQPLSNHCCCYYSLGSGATMGGVGEELQWHPSPARKLESDGPTTTPQPMPWANWGIAAGGGGGLGRGGGIRVEEEEEAEEVSVSQSDGPPNGIEK